LDPASRRTRILEADGTHRTFAYDERGRLLNEMVAGGQAPSYSQAFTYDSVGNRTSLVRTGFTTECFTYAYDSRDRLQTENSAAFSSDLDGNITGREGVGSYVWDADNRLVQVTVGTMTETNTYDADGNRVQTKRTLGASSSDIVGYVVDST